MQDKGEVFTYDGKEWQIIKDDSISPSKHCEHCEFSQYCEEYIEKNEWFACGCAFSSDSIYIKNIK